MYCNLLNYKEIIFDLQVRNFTDYFHIENDKKVSQMWSRQTNKQTNSSINILDRLLAWLRLAICFNLCRCWASTIVYSGTLGECVTLGDLLVSLSIVSICTFWDLFGSSSTVSTGTLGDFWSLFLWMKIFF